MDENLWWEHFATWPLRDRFELLAFESGLPQDYIAEASSPPAE